MLPFKTVGILGSGTMGAGIAQIAAQNGYVVRLYDIEQSFLEKAKNTIEAGFHKLVEKGKLRTEEADAATGRLVTTTELSELSGCDLIIEAVPENLELKRKLFGELDKICGSETILASNTSSLSITAIAGATERPAQVAGLHFFNPVFLMPLVEVIQGQRTAPESVQKLADFAESLGKTVVRAKDTPGFIVNRVARPFYGEALNILGENANEPEMHRTIDRVLTEAGGFKMGPFTLMDLIGIDVNFDVTQSVYAAFFQHPRYRPHPIQRRMVEAGLLGRKTGEGFYQYD